jgi:hypothetical protein
MASSKAIRSVAFIRFSASSCARYASEYSPGSFESCVSLSTNAFHVYEF